MLIVFSCAKQEDLDLPTPDAATASGGEAGEMASTGGSAATGGGSTTGGTSAGGLPATGGLVGTGGAAGSDTAMGGTGGMPAGGTGGTAGNPGAGGTPPGVDCSGQTEVACAGQSTEFPVGGSLYCHTRSQRSWLNALCACINWGGTLAAIETQAEQLAIAAEVSSVTWIGANDLQAEGSWVWTTGASLSYQNWDAAGFEPNGTTNENCSTLVGWHATDVWRSEPCTSTEHYLCEKPL